MVAAAAIALPAALGAQNDPLSESREVQQEIDDAAKATQEKIDQLSEEAQQMLAEYRSARDQAANLEVYNDQLARQVASQRKKIESVRAQLESIEETRQQFVPMMTRAVDALGEFVSRDLPFKPEERKAKVKELRDLLGRADVSTAETFRQIMAAYQQEVKYGRTIESYRRGLKLDGEMRTVRVLRIGRVALLYQTLDGQRTGRWNPAAGEWQSLGNDYRAAVEKGLQVASEQAPPDLLRAPLTASGGR